MSMPALACSDVRTEYRLREMEEKLKLTLELMQHPWVCVANGESTTFFYGVSDNLDGRLDALHDAEEYCKKDYPFSHCNVFCHKNPVLLLLLKNAGNKRN